MTAPQPPQPPQPPDPADPADPAELTEPAELDGPAEPARPSGRGPTLLWSPAPARAALPPGSVDVLAFRLDAPEHEVAAAARMIDPEERARADRLVTAELRARSVISHATQRRILAAYTGTPPEELRFEFGPKGKPALAGAHGETAFSRSGTSEFHPRLHFNLSHSGGLGLLAVSAESPFLGVDLEQIERPVDLEPLARRCFTGEEYAGFRTLAGAERGLGFFLGWTRKEAFMKATGEGLSRPLDSFEVELRPAAPPCFLRLPEPERPADWTLEHLVPARDFVGALAVRTGGARLRVRPWSWTRGFS